MPTTPLPEHLTRVTYILDKVHKAKLEAAAQKAGVSMSVIISRALAKQGILPKKAA